MKVHFTASNFNLAEHYDDFAAIVNHIKKNGHILTREWIDEDLARQQHDREYTFEEYRAIWQKVKMSIIEADLVIVEGWNNSYSIGYQTAFALSYKKPVLVLAPNTKISHTIIAGEDNPFLHIVHYTRENLGKVLDEFFLKYQPTGKEMRFNMFIDRETQVYLDMESYKTGKTKAKIIRDLIKREMDKNDGLS